VPEFHRQVYRDLAQEKRFYYITCPSEFGKCLDEDTLITLHDGRRIPIKHIKPGDRIWSKTPDEKIELDTVEHLWNRGEKECMELTTWSGKRITTTPEHRFYTINGWKHLSELAPGDFVAVPKRLDTQEVESMDIHTAKFLMYMIMEGAVSSGNCRFSTANDDILHDFIQTCQALGFSVTKLHGDNYDWNINGGSRTLLRKYGLYGHTAHTKRLPTEFYTLPRRYKPEIIRVIFGTDGYITKNGMGIQLCNKALIDDINTFLLTMGIHGRIYSKHVKYNGGYNASWEWFTADKDSVLTLAEIGAYGKMDKCAIIINRKENLKPSGPGALIPAGWQTNSGVNTYFLRKMYGIRVDTHSKSTTLEKLRNVAWCLPDNGRIQNLAWSDLYWDKVKSIDYAGIRHTYDIQTVRNKNFVANNIVVHNTTIATLIYPIYRALYKLDAYITVGGSTQDLSQEEHFDNIKRELMENEKLIAIFGTQRTERRNTQNTRYKPWSTSEYPWP